MIAREMREAALAVIRERQPINTRKVLDLMGMDADTPDRSRATTELYRLRSMGAIRPHPDDELRPQPRWILAEAAAAAAAGPAGYVAADGFAECIVDIPEGIKAGDTLLLLNGRCVGVKRSRMAVTVPMVEGVKLITGPAEAVPAPPKAEQKAKAAPKAKAKAKQKRPGRGNSSMAMTKILAFAEKQGRPVLGAEMKKLVGPAVNWNTVHYARKKLTERGDLIQGKGADGRLTWTFKQQAKAAA